MEVAGVVVHPVESHHWSFAVTPKGELLSGPAVGYIVEAAPDVRIYHPGDSAISYDMKLWGSSTVPTVGLMVVAVPEDSLPHMECYRSGEMTVLRGPPREPVAGPRPHRGQPLREPGQPQRHGLRPAGARSPPKRRGCRPESRSCEPGEVIDL